MVDEASAKGEIISAITEIGRPASISEIVKRVGLERHTLSKYLMLLKREGTLDYELIGRAKLWRLNTAPLEGILAPSSEKKTYAERMLAGIIANVPAGVLVMSDRHRVQFANGLLRRIYGEPAGRTFEAYVLGSGNHKELREIEDVLAGKAAMRECEVRDAQGHELLVRASALHNPDGSRSAVLIIEDITFRKHTAQLLVRKAAQRKVISELGMEAIAGNVDLGKLFERAAHGLSQALDAEYCDVLELLGGGRELLLRAGTGWKEGLVGKARVPADRNSQAGYTLLSKGPVIVTDLRTDNRFLSPKLLLDHHVVSGLSVIIHCADGPWGVLGVFTKRKFEWTEMDVDTLQAAANILGTVIERRRINDELRREKERAQQYITRAGGLFVVVDKDRKVIHINDEGAALLGHPREEIIGSDWFERFVPERIRKPTRKALEPLFSGEGAPTKSYANPVLARDGSERLVLWNNAVWAENGKIMGVVASGTDITDVDPPGPQESGPAERAKGAARAGGRNG